MTNPQSEIGNRKLPPPGLTKGELLASGPYAALPLAVLSRQDLTPAAKLTYAALVNCLRGDRSAVQASLADLADAAGLSRTAVQTALRQLADAGLIRAVPRPGQPALYLLTEPAATVNTRTESDQVTAPTQPESGCLPDRNPPDTQPESTSPHPYERKEGRREEEPPNPPEGGECVNLPVTAAEAQATADAAHRQAYGRPSPASWARRIRREFDHGDRRSLAEIDAKAVRAGRALAKAAGRTFGIGWVLRHLADAAAARQDRLQADQRAQDAAHVAREAQDAQDARWKARDAQRLAAAAFPPRQKPRRGARERMKPKRRHRSPGNHSLQTKDRTPGCLKPVAPQRNAP